ncbi:MAG: ABC transporter substrate-binding protein [Bacillota bacterium]|nr:MAG: ABC transporter substrate-binding protein [Bacillota bacterium]
MKRILIALVVIILIASMSLVGCKKAGVTSETPTVFTMANNIDCMWSWDPSDAFGEELPILFELYETLTRYHPLEDELEPVLATDWSVSPDGLTWTFTLREGVKFHCGHDFDSSDVKRSIERTMERGMGAAFIWLAVNSIETPDEKTVVFNLDYPVPIDLTVASAYGAFMYCMDCVEEKGEDYLSAGNELGTGPYKLQQWKRGDQVLLEKFGDYWRGWDGNHFEKVLLKVVPESGTARQMLEAGQVDYVRLLPFEDIEALKQNAAFTVTATPGFQNVYILINTQREPTNDPRVRQALAYSVPYDQIIENVMYGYATQSVGPIPKGMWGHDDTLPQYTYDLETARQLLTDAGYPDGGFSLMMTVASGDENHRKVAELWKAELTKLGIDLDIRTMPFDAQWDLAKSSNLDERQDLYILYYWPDVCSPQCYLEGCFITQTDPIIFNLCYYSDPQVDEWIIEAWETAGRDREAATAIYRQIQEKLIEDSPAIFLYDMQNVRVMNSSIRNFTDNPAYPYVLFIYDLYREEG